MLDVRARFARPILEEVVNRVLPFDNLCHLGWSLMMLRVLHNIEGVNVLDHDSVEGLVV